MSFLEDVDLRVGGIVGIILHFAMLWNRVAWLKWECGSNCPDILAFDLPTSIFYYGFSDGGVIAFSLILGSITWAFYGFFLLKLIRFILNRFA